MSSRKPGIEHNPANMALMADIPFMFLAASSGSENDRGQSLALGAARFLRRTVEPQEALAQIEACLRKYDKGDADGHHLDR